MKHIQVSISILIATMLVSSCIIRNYNECTSVNQIKSLNLDKLVVKLDKENNNIYLDIYNLDTSLLKIDKIVFTHKQEVLPLSKCVQNTSNHSVNCFENGIIGGKKVFLYKNKAFQIGFHTKQILKDINTDSVYLELSINGQIYKKDLFFKCSKYTKTENIRFH